MKLKAFLCDVLPPFLSLSLSHSQPDSLNLSHFSRGRSNFISGKQDFSLCILLCLHLSFPSAKISLPESFEGLAYALNVQITFIMPSLTNA